jgi:hypothetical protein
VTRERGVIRRDLDRVVHGRGALPAHGESLVCR